VRQHQANSSKWNLQLTIMANFDEQTHPSKKAKTEPTLTTYEFRVYFGDPSAGFPSRLKTAKKEVIQDCMRRSGLPAAMLNGSKVELLHRLQTVKPFVDVKIGSKQPLRNVLFSALKHWKWDGSHLCRMKMPRRGESKIGCTKYKNHDAYMDLVGFRRNDPSWLREIIEKYESRSEETFRSSGKDKSTCLKLLRGIACSGAFRSLFA
jgi:hypothetical protein